MPLYEYECDACGHRFEVIQKFSDPPVEKCPKCGSHVHKLMSSPAIQFKGTGWYVTDYARSGSGSDGKSSKDSAAKDKDTKTTDTPAESKSEAKTDKAAAEKSSTTSTSDTGTGKT